MPRFFNTSGPCNPDKHYMLPAVPRVPLARPLIEQELYFTVHAARQTGKSTAFAALAKALTAEGKYAALRASCERGQAAGNDVGRGVVAVVRAISDWAEHDLPQALRPPAPDVTLEGESLLIRYLTAWAQSCPRPIALFLDEIDALQDATLVAVLRQLRDGAMRRPDAFPQSIALIGLRDVRDYKIRTEVRDNGSSYGTASPFNIKSDALTLRDFTAAEVAELLGQHTEQAGQVFEPEAAATIFELSHGQPWLANALAGQLTTHPDALLSDPAVPVTREHVWQVRDRLIERRDTHLDSLVDKLREDRVRRVIEPILAGGSLALDLVYDDDVSYAQDLGLVARREGRLVIANPIYAEIIPRVLTSFLQDRLAAEPIWYLTPDGILDVPKMIEGFLRFWQRNGEVLLRGMPYHEAAPHLVFLAFLQRVVNGGGRVEREFAAGTGRADLVVEMGGQQDIFELKILRGHATLPEGLEQVARYAHRLSRDLGYLVIFDPKSDEPWEDRGRIEELEEAGVRVVVVWA